VLPVVPIFAGLGALTAKTGNPIGISLELVFFWSLLICAYLYKYIMGIFASRRRARVLATHVLPLNLTPTRTRPVCTNRGKLGLNLIIMCLHLVLVGTTMIRAESKMHRVMRSDSDDSDTTGLGFNRAMLVHMISSEALLQCVLQFLIMSQTMYELYSAWLASALLSLCYHLKMLMFAGDKTIGHLEAVGLVMISYFGVLWLGSSVEHRMRTFFLLARRDMANAKREQKRAKERHRLDLLELQASAGMSRLYHVLKNIFVGIHDIMRARDVEITPRDRDIIQSCHAGAQRHRLHQAALRVRCACQGHLHEQRQEHGLTHVFLDHGHIACHPVGGVGGARNGADGGVRDNHAALCRHRHPDKRDIAW
jgi:hypothetical protein